MSFLQNNWMLILVLVMSGAMLVWPLVQRRLSPVKDIGNLEATRLINSANAVLVDVRETKEFEGGRLPKAVHIPLSQLDGRGDELAKLRRTARRRLLHVRQPQPDGGQRPRAPRASRTSTSCRAATAPGRTPGCPSRSDHADDNDVLDGGLPVLHPGRALSQGEGRRRRSNSSASISIPRCGGR